MECPSCHTIKLSNEFLMEPNKHDDKTLNLQCLRCCAAENDEFYREIAKQKLDQLFDLKTRNLVQNGEISDDQHEEGIVHILSLEGEKFNVEFTKLMTVNQLKIKLQQEFMVMVPTSRISFNFNNMELENGRTLGDYNVRNGSNIYLMILLYQIESNIDKINFNLTWGFKESQKDYLDTTCLFYDSKKQFIGLIDYQNLTFDQFQHSGDRMGEKTGNHIILANLSNVVQSHYIFFVLSAFNSPTIAAFESPEFKFFDDSDPNTSLCQYNIAQAANNQAVIMSVIYRKNNGGWNVAGLGKFSDGNAKDYTKIKETIHSIFEKTNF